MINTTTSLKKSIKTLELSLDRFMSMTKISKKTRNEMRKILNKISALEDKLTISLHEELNSLKESVKRIHA